MVCSTFSDFQRLIKGKFDAYVLRPLAKKLQNWIVDRSTARKFTVPIWIVKVTECLFLKFRLSDKHTKFEKHLPHGLYIYVVNVKTMRKILCASQKVWTLPIWIVDLRGRGSVYQKIFWTRPISNFSISWPKGQEIEIGDQSLVQKIFRYTDPLPLRSTHFPTAIKKSTELKVIMSGIWGSPAVSVYFRLTKSLAINCLEIFELACCDKNF